MVQKKFINFFICIFCFYLSNNLNASDSGQSYLEITNCTTLRTEDHHVPFIHKTLGQLSWNNTHVALLSQVQITWELDPRVVSIKSNQDFYNCTYKNLPTWNNPDVNAYLIPWPANLTHKELDISFTEGDKKSSLEDHLFKRSSSNGRPMFFVASKTRRAFHSGMHDKNQIYNYQPHNKYSIFYNNRYMIICYNQKGFEITNIAQMNGFSLDINQRQNLHESKLYLWEYKNKPIIIETNDKDSAYRYSLELNIEKIKNIHKQVSFVSKFISYKWLILCALGVLGIAILVKKAVQLR